MDENEFREFWIFTDHLYGSASKNKSRVIHVGKGGEERPFLSFAYNQVHHNISYIAFASWKQTKLEYEILNGKIGKGFSCV